jgi:peptide/nickel transport system substrate-binding protein
MKIVKSVEAIDPHTVKITFKQVNPAWSLVFVGTEGMILPAHLYEKYSNETARQAPANSITGGNWPL